MASNTTITDTDTNLEYTLPAGLSARAGNTSYRCDDCRQWAHAGDTVRHSRNCDTANLQPLSVAAATGESTVCFGRTRRGQRVVVGPVAEVVSGATLTVDGETVVVSRVGRSFERAGVEVCYGYLADAIVDPATVVECLECGAVEGRDVPWVASHRMGCARC